MSRYAQENVVSVVLLAVFAGVIVLCQDFGVRARMIPLPLAVFGIILTLIQMAWHNFGSTAELQMDMITVEVPAAPGGTEPAAPPPRKSREAVAYGIIVILLGLVYLVGIIPAIFVFTAGYFLLSRYCSWLASLIYTAVLTATVYLLFVVALEMQPYHGLLEPLFK